LPTTAFSIDLSGKWTGKMALDGTALKKQLKEQSAKLTGKPKQQIDNRIKVIDQSIQFVDKTKIKLDLKKGGVAFVEFNRNGKSEPEWCKWKAQGKKITLSGFTGGGDSMTTLQGTIATGAKTIVFDMSYLIARQMNAQGLRASTKPKMTLTFKKN
ncbi:MAG: hypothetical protein WCG75_11825, partial [Armatimonadota bacterium]